MGTNFGLTADNYSNVYTTDAYNGFIWRVDGGTQSMYVVGGGGAATTAGTTCATVNGIVFTATDTYGDGCPGLLARFGIGTGTSGYTTTGIFGITEDYYSNVYVGDTVTSLVREVSSGTEFGVVGANQPTNIVDVHFAIADGPLATGAYSVTSVPANSFSVGAANCTTNSDNTTDCLLSLTATPSALGVFTGTLTVKSVLVPGGNTFPLSGDYVQSPVTRTSLVASVASSCGTSTVYSTTANVTLTATLAANGPSAPSGSIIFKDSGVALAPTAGVAITNTGSASSPVYQAVLNYTFTTVGSHTITATYTGDSYFKGSTSTVAAFSTALPAYTTALTSYSQATVTPGQTALYSFSVTESVYTGTITYACSGLPAASSCSFSPASGIVGVGCSTPTGLPAVVALSILTTAAQKPGAAGFGGTGRWQLAGTLAGLTMALLIGIRRRKYGLRFGNLWMALALLLAASSTLACNTAGTTVAGTPPFSGTITVTFTGTDGTVQTVPVPLVVN